ncbi:MAG: GNAT family N-acetyltransferase [Anaerolineales bacterium]|nr:GNAT family N-acetyltransferase [Anaerolineales bacterium]
MIETRHLFTYADLQATITIQQTMWTDPTILVHPNMLLSIAKNGGAIIGAFDGDQMVGFVFGFLGATGNPAHTHLKFTSQRMAILPEYRDQGIGYQLKRAQREYALSIGLDHMTWTFDPLFSRNAYFNFHKIGAISRIFAPDYYGAASPLARLGTTDRLIVDWHLNQPTRPRIHNPQDLPCVHTAPDIPQSQPFRFEIPYSYPTDPTWRSVMARLFEGAFSQGYAVVDFYVDEDKHSFYVFAPTPVILNQE